MSPMPPMLSVSGLAHIILCLFNGAVAYPVIKKVVSSLLMFRTVLLEKPDVVVGTPSRVLLQLQQKVPYIYTCSWYFSWDLIFTKAL